VPKGTSLGYTAGFSQTASLVAVELALKPLTTTFAYDPMGDRTRKTDPFGTITAYGNDQANRLTSFQVGGGPTTTYKYDGDGLRLGKGGRAFTWDASGSTPLLLSDGSTNYIYGPGGMPVEQVVAPQAISRVAQGSGARPATQTSSLAFNLSAAPRAGDEVVLGITAQQVSGESGTPPAPDFTVPSGYVLEATARPAVNTNAEAWLYVLKATGSEGATISISEPGTPALPYAMQAAATVYRGVDPNPASSIQGATTNTSASGSVQAPPISTSVAGEELVLFQGVQDNAMKGTFSADQGMAEETQVRQALGDAAMADLALGAAGTSPSPSATYSAANGATSAAAMIALRPIPGTYFLHQDQLGSTRKVTDPSGFAVDSLTYDAYGNPTFTGTVGVALRYAGQYFDAESGMYYLRARYYEPATAQFLSKDPEVTTTRHAYAYVVDNPLNRTDPTGLATMGLCVGVDAGALAAAGGSWCHSNDTSGGAAVVATGGVGFGATYGASVSTTLQFSTAETNADLAGPFAQFSVAIPFFACSFFWGNSPHGTVYGGNIGFGGGLGARYSATGQGTTSTVQNEERVDPDGGVSGGSQGSDLSGDAAFYGSQPRCRQNPDGSFTCG
jgi:RHS repeat-associated protein